MKHIQKMFAALSLIITFVLFVVGQDQSKERANEIIRNSKASIGLIDELSKYALLGVEYESLKTIKYANQTEQQQKAEGKLYLSPPNKIYYEELSTYPSNQVSFKKIINGENYKMFDEKLLFDGVIKNIPDSSEVQAFKNDKKARSEDLKLLAFLKIFPITFDDSILATNFKYIGLAESPEGTANIIETILDNGNTFRLFFDTKTNLLLMATRNWISATTQKEVENKYFFSDYKKKNGVLVAGKITVEREQQVIEETKIKDLKLNPTVPQNLFEIK